MKKLSLISQVVLLLLSLVSTHNILAEIREIKHFSELSSILSNAAPDALIVFDVDEVLVYPENVVQLQVAADFWEKTMEGVEERLGKEKRNAMHAAMLLQSKWALTDAQIPTLIQTLQAKQNTLVALTAFWVGKMGEIDSVEHWRREHLRNEGIDFSKNAQLPQGHFQIEGGSLTIKNGNNPVYHEGIIFTNRHPKSQVLHAFLQQIRYSPKEIIFIDDRMSNIKDLENFCQTVNISFLGIHDNRIFSKHHHFDEKTGKFQFEYLEKHHIWLRDIEVAAKADKG